MLDEAGGIHVSAETARRLACDAATVTMHHAPGGEILDVGRRTRTISPALRRALAARDRQCRFPGWGNVRCDAHHIEHWADGGRTSLDNLVLLCRRHHRVVHEEGYRVTIDAAGDVKFLRPDGHPLPEAPPAPTWTGPALQPTSVRGRDSPIGAADHRPRRSRGNVGGRGTRIGAQDHRRPRARGNARDGARGGAPVRRQTTDTRGEAGPGRTRPPTTTPDLRPVSGHAADDGLAAAGSEIGADTATPSWRGEPLDLDYAMRALWRPRREPVSE